MSSICLIFIGGRINQLAGQRWLDFAMRLKLVLVVSPHLEVLLERTQPN